MLDPSVMADMADLRYVSDEEPGINRQRKGRGFSYVRHDGSVVPPKVRARIKSLAVPPAWEQVWICTDPQGHIQATGRDEAGRKQYRYHPEWERARDEVKFDRMVLFGRRLPHLRKHVGTDLNQRGLPLSRVLALGVAVLDQTLIRVGNDRYTRENGSFGLTTITNTHADVTGHEVQFNFIAKGGASSEVALSDKRLANLIAQCQELGGQSLFTYRDSEGEVGSVRSEHLNAYLRRATGLEVSAKDFRTWGASALLTDRLGHIGVVEQPERELLTAIDQVAEVLGNTRAVARSSYVHPAVSEAFTSGSLDQIWHGSRAGRWLSRGESTLLKLLEQN
ncbi:MAG: DNA topoisomerase IB [Actinobacteria bacterium]|nr:DNA topoisomerase IB [Actinomycetota bacterium]